MPLKPSDRASRVQPFIVMDFFREANALAAAGHDVVHMSAGQPAGGPPSKVIEAARDALNGAYMGYTDSLGRITISSKGMLVDRMQALFHEQVHSFLTPKGPLQSTRARYSLWAYHNSHLLRYAEEAMAETYAQWRTGGSLSSGLLFPLANGYVDPYRVALEGMGVGATVTALGYWLGLHLME